MRTGRSCPFSPIRVIRLDSSVLDVSRTGLTDPPFLDASRKTRLQFASGPGNQGVDSGAA